MPGTSVLYAIYIIAFARLIVLITRDTITEVPRDWLVTLAKDRGHNGIAYMLLCPWCVSIWLAIPAAPIIYAYGHNRWLFMVALVGALSAAAGVLARVKG